MNSVEKWHSSSLNIAVKSETKRTLCCKTCRKENFLTLTFTTTCFLGWTLPNFSSTNYSIVLVC